MIAQRNKKSFMGGKWEFPGGKIEKGETAKKCLAREISEEFGASVEVGELLTKKVEYRYTDVKNVRLHAYFCKVKRGTVKALEHEDIAWILPEQLRDYDLVPADKEIAAALLEKV